MDIDYAQKLLDVLIDNSRQVLAAGFGLNWAESTFFEIIRLIRENPDVKTYFLKRVRDTLTQPAPGNLEPGIVPTELIELIGHEFRWKELLQIAEDRVNNVFRGDASLATGDIATSLPEAFDDMWEDRMFYTRYHEQ